MQNNIIKSSSSSSSIFNINSICRGCLSDRIETLQSIHSHSIQHLFTECTNLQITDCDDLPTKICSSCVYKCVSWHSFKQQCEYSENAIRNQLIHLRNDVQQSPKTLSDECTSDISSNRNIQSFNHQQSSEWDNIYDVDKKTSTTIIIDKTPNAYTVYKVLSTLPARPQKEQQLNSKRTILEHIRMNNPTDPISVINDYDDVDELDLKREQEIMCNDDAAQQIIDDLVDDSNICSNIDVDGEKNNENKLKKCHETVNVLNKLHENVDRKQKTKIKQTNKRKVKVKTQLLAYTCDLCKTATFRKRDRLEAHLRVHMGKKPEICKLCNKEFNNLRAVKRHYLSHNDLKQYSCTECGKMYKYQTSLTLHKKIHLNIRSFVCDLCGKSFVRAHGLQSHLLSHTTERSFQCNLCGKRFKNHIMLRNHQLRHSGIKNFACTNCDKTFTTSAELTTHYRTHTGIKPFPCAMCNKYYKTKSHLAVHFRTHTGVRPYPCDLCPLSFAHNKVLKQHRLTHTGERPYICHVCDRPFRQKSTLNVHLSVHERQRVQSTNKE